MMEQCGSKARFPDEPHQMAAAIPAWFMSPKKKKKKS